MLFSQQIARLLIGCWVIVAARSSAATPIPATAMVEGMRLHQVALSPQGSRMSLLIAGKDRVTVIVRDLKTGTMKAVLESMPKERIDPVWCGWANETRLLCSYRGLTADTGFFYPYTRLVAINADGSDGKVLLQNARDVTGGAQLQDQIIDWTVDDPETVLMQIDEDQDSYPAVFAVNVYTGYKKLIERQKSPIRSFMTDGHGRVRFGYGLKGATLSYYARLDQSKDWQQLSKAEAFAASDSFVPVAAEPGTNFVLAYKELDGRQALWRIDLEDKRAPEVVFGHPLFDVDGILQTPTGQVIGVSYMDERPAVYYTDSRLKSYLDAVSKALPNSFNSLVDMTVDQTQLVVRSESDTKPPTYYLMSLVNGQLAMSVIGSSLPGVSRYTLAPMRAISYPASDGTRIPGYLTVPSDVRARNLPLIVLPHGGPIHRDVWGFDDLVQFFASRGYAVLQMNFRGSSGYGTEWQHAAHQDWGGLSYSDIIDGAKWAVAEGIADPARMCMVGWSFGGYAALLAASRHSEMFKCIVSIAGVSDLPEMMADDASFVNYAVVRKQVGTSMEKLRADSPRLHVENTSTPILLIHGAHDFTVTVQQTKLMAAALKKHNKPHRVVIIDEADHNLAYSSDRLTLFSELDRFLTTALNAR